jgi:hypothetical protein
MTRGAKVRRGVVVLSVVVAGAAGCAASRSAEPVSRAGDNLVVSAIRVRDGAGGGGGGAGGR